MVAYLGLLGATAWASAMSPRNIVRYIIFYTVTMVIVGLKYEVGFDWDVYSREFVFFSGLRFSDFTSNFSYYLVLFAHEPLFLFVAFLASKVFPSFELFYFAIYLFFVYSVVRLGKVLNANYIAAFVLIHLFLLFTLEFSTVRQLLAIAVFNVGVALALEGRTGKSALMLIIAPFFQASSIVYILLFLMVVSTRRATRIVIVLSILLVILINGFGVSAFLNRIGMFVPSVFASKLDYYANDKEYGFSLAENAFSLVVYLFLMVFSLNNQKSPDEKVRILATFLSYLILLALAGFAIPTIRNRMLYEIIIIASLLLFSDGALRKVDYALPIIALGIFFFGVSLVKPTSFMFVPYQNYVWYKMWDIESDGLERQSRLSWEIRHK